MRVPAAIVTMGLALAGACGETASAADAAATWVARSGTARVAFDEHRLSEFGMAVVPPGRAKRELRPYSRWENVALAGRVEFTLEHGHHVRAESGAFRLATPFALRLGGRHGDIVLETLRAADADRTHFQWADARGKAWLVVDSMHQRWDAQRASIALTSLDVRVGPALAAALGRPEADGQPIGALDVTLAGPKRADVVSSCNDPSWPGTPGLTTDVVLSQLFQLGARCGNIPPQQVGYATPECPGNATNPNARVVLVPSVQLRNDGQTDVPWYEKFSTITPPGAYPYATIDQHPFLVWNAYRLDASGRLVQIGRSGLKHAFATENQNCSCPNSQILAPMCTDRYGYNSNDIDPYLGPRRELIPRLGVWGRCMSRFDTNCDGVEGDENYNLPTLPTFTSERLAVPEADLVPALNAGARWFIESWYVIRDDANLYNTMGHREFFPTYSSFWTTPLGATFRNGPVVDLWVDPSAPSATQRNDEIAHPNGRVKLAVKATDLGGGEWRYDYAIMNFELGMETTTGAEPNLRVVSNKGFVSVRFAIDPAHALSAIGFHDGTADPADDWTSVRDAAQLRYDAPPANSLDWGSMYQFTFVANAPPAAGTVTLVPDGGIAFSTQSLVPGEPPLFLDGFEQ
jgi:hypothetical protein